MKLSGIIKALLKPSAYPDDTYQIELRQTHISYLFFTNDLVYKVKKPINLGFLDFTTLERRQFFCRQELALNRRMTKDVYLDVVPITIDKGKIKIAGKGKIIEYAVKMKRLPEENMLDRLVNEDKVTRNNIERVASVIADFHVKAISNRAITRFGLPSVIGTNVEENFTQTIRSIDKTITKGQFERVTAYTRDFLESNKGLLLERVKGPFIKDLHGDIHLEHICILNGVQIFDCIEFNERFRYSDVVADMAFLSMDLDFYNRSDLSMMFSDFYFDMSGDKVGQRLLNFYKCYRAYVRGKVEGFKLDEAEVSDEEKWDSLIRAKRYFHLANQYTEAGPRPTLIIICGFIGTGKTSLAEDISEKLQIPVISSDNLRKELAGLPLHEHSLEGFERGIYSKGFTEKTYAELIKMAVTYLKKGRSVIVEATFSRAEQRDAMIRDAKKCGSEIHIIRCTAPDDIIKERLKKRVKENSAVSDGRWTIYLKQKPLYEDLYLPHMSVDTALAKKDVLFSILEGVLG